MPKARFAGGERSLSKERILVVGVGGLGVPASVALARAGVSAIGVVDPDPVELSNLARQVIYQASDIGQLKVEAAARHLGAQFPATRIETHACALDRSNATGLVSSYDFIIDATDDPAAKFLINDACIEAGRPFSYGGVLGLAGQTMTVLPGLTACLRCLFGEPPPPEEIASCRDAGILGPVAGAIGEIQTAEAIAWLRQRSPGLVGRFLTYQGAGPLRVRVAAVNPRPGCGCGAARTAAESSAG